MKKLEAFEMWIWRKIEKIRWEDKKSNEEVLSKVGEERCLIKTIIMRKRNWIGHVLRHEGLMKEVLEGGMEGKRDRGRPRMGMLNELDEGSYEQMKRRAEDRDKWREWVPRTCLRQSTNK